MSVSFDSASTLQAATSHQCSHDADGDGEGGRNGYPSDSVEAALIRDKLDVVSSENHDQMEGEASGSEETPYSSSGSDGEGVGSTCQCLQCLCYICTCIFISPHGSTNIYTQQYSKNI